MKKRKRSKYIKSLVYAILYGMADTSNLAKRLRRNLGLRRFSVTSKTVGVGNE